YARAIRLQAFGIPQSWESPRTKRKVQIGKARQCFAGQKVQCLWDRSGNQRERLAECLLLQGGTLTKPGGVQPVIITARPSLVIDKIGDGIEQAIGGTVVRGQMRSATFAIEKRTDLTHGSLVGLLLDLLRTRLE